jgi:hypothetical protein
LNRRGRLERGSCESLFVKLDGASQLYGARIGANHDQQSANIDVTVLAGCTVHDRNAPQKAITFDFGDLRAKLKADRTTLQHVGLVPAIESYGKCAGVRIR